MNDEHVISRRTAIQAGIATLLAPGALWALGQKVRPLVTRPIPSSGELLPVIGIGTARGYSSPSTEERLVLQRVLEEFNRAGGRVIETSPEYRGAEAVLGGLIGELGLRDSLFLADTAAADTDLRVVSRQFAESLRRLGTERVDLLQLPLDSVSAETMALANEFKAQGKARYIGLVAVGSANHVEVERLLRTERFDFLQVDMSAEERSAARRVLPTATDRGVAVIIDHPFGRGQLFESVLGKAIPKWARDIDAASWAQIFLKYLIAQPGVTAVIPGTERVEYVIDNLAAGRGRLPDAGILRRIEAAVA